MESSVPERDIVIQAAADLHGELFAVARCDLLVLAGDLVPYDIEDDAAACREWLAGEFADWLAAAPADEVIAVAGNHDYWATELSAGAHARLCGAPWTYLQDAGTTTTSGLRVHGSPWTPDVYGSAFEAPADELARIWAAIPGGLDLLVVHCPPRGYGDRIAHAGEAPTAMGAPELLDAIERARPRLVLYGHAHQASGFCETTPAGTRLANVSVRTDYVGGLGRPSVLHLASA